VSPRARPKTIVLGEVQALGSKGLPETFVATAKRQTFSASRWWPFNPTRSLRPSLGLARADVCDDALSDMSEGFVRADSAFFEKLEWLPAVVPLAHLFGGEGVAQLPCCVASDRLVKADVELVDARDASVVSPELFQSMGIVAEIEDSIEDDVVPEVERLASGSVDEHRCVGGSRLFLATSQEFTPKVVLVDHCSLVTEKGSQRRCSRRLA